MKKRQREMQECSCTYVFQFLAGCPRSICCLRTAYAYARASRMLLDSGVATYHSQRSGHTQHKSFRIHAGPPYYQPTSWLLIIITIAISSSGKEQEHLPASRV